MEPLAHRMKPKQLEKFYGQENIVGENKLLYRLIKSDKLTSAIFWGPSGTGKTSLARIIANTTECKFVEINATSGSVKDLKKVVEDSKNLFLNPTGKTIVFIDEIHRFNKLQQDALLPYVESGVIILIGATTENPYFEVNKALLSRSTIFKFEKLTKENIKSIINNTILDKENGLGNYNINITEEVIDILADISCGDVRTALNTLELAVITTDIDKDGSIIIDKEVILESCERKLVYDKSDSSHYDTISAFIKSMRGSNPNASVYYLAKMLESGEDPLFIARRIVICASEDVGLANSKALSIAVSAMNAVHQIGMPEARIILSHAAIYIAKSPKSNSAYLAINNALEDVRNISAEVPYHLRNAEIKGMENFGYKLGYKYPHDYEGGHVTQQYMPDNLVDRKYYIPKEGIENEREES